MSKEVFSKEYFNLPDLAQYSGLGIRFLRDVLKDPEHPLPHFRMNKKTIIVSRSEFKEWIEIFRAGYHDELEQIVDQIMIEFPNRKPRRTGQG